MMRVVPNSHFWTDLDMMIRWIEVYPKDTVPKDELIMGLRNTLKEMYNLKKVRLTKKDEKFVKEVSDAVKRYSESTNLGEK